MKRAFSIVLVIVMACMMTPVLLLATPESVSAESWVEVVRITTVEHSGFTCAHAEWRIRWSYQPVGDVGLIDRSEKASVSIQGLKRQ